MVRCCILLVLVLKSVLSGLASFLEGFIQFVKHQAGFRSDFVLPCSSATSANQ